MDKRKHYHLILDVETANTLEHPLVYDIGGFIGDQQGNIYEPFSFVIRDVFVYERELMKTAYYAEKIPRYIEDIKSGEKIMINFLDARNRILNLMKKYNVTEVAAYNANFDYNALNTTIRWITKSKYRFFFPYGTQIVCIWNMACQTLCNRKTYKYFCEENQLFSNHEKNYSTSAETVYKYLLLNPSYKESHTGYEDTLIEYEIFIRCLKAHKKFPDGKGIKRNCWMKIKRG